MGDFYKCPIDGTVLAPIPEKGTAETICSACRRAYRITRGKVSSIEVQHGKPEPHLTTVALTLSADGAAVTTRDAVPTERWSSPGDGTMTTIAQRGKPNGADWKLLSIQFGARDPAVLGEARDTAAIRTVGTAVQGTVLTVFAVILLVYFYHWAFVLAALPGLALTALAAAWRWKTTATRRDVSARALETLQREQWLLGRLLHYETEGAAVTKRIERYNRQRNELQALQADIERAGNGYEARLDLVRRAVEVVRRHIENDQKLRDAIARATTMVELEYRAARLLEHLPDDTMDRISQTILELDAMEEENRALEAQLEANAEVRMLTS